MRGAKPRPNSCMQDWSCWPPTTPRWSCGEAKHHNRATGEQQPVRFTAHQLHSPYLPPRKIRRIATAVQEAHGCPGSTQPSRRDLHSTGTSTWQGVGVRALRATVKLPHGPAHFAWSPASRLTGSPFLPMRAESFAPTGSALGGALQLLTAAESHLSQSGRPFDAQHYLAQQNCHCSEHYGDHSFRKARGER